MTVCYFSASIATKPGFLATSAFHAKWQFCGQEDNFQFQTKNSLRVNIYLIDRDDQRCAFKLGCVVVPVFHSDQGGVESLWIKTNSSHKTQTLASSRTKSQDEFNFFFLVQGGVFNPQHFSLRGWFCWNRCLFLKAFQHLVLKGDFNDGMGMHYPVCVFARPNLTKTELRCANVGQVGSAPFRCFCHICSCFYASWMTTAERSVQKPPSNRQYRLVLWYVWWMCLYKFVLIPSRDTNIECPTVQPHLSSSRPKIKQIVTVLTTKWTPNDKVKGNVRYLKDWAKVFSEQKPWCFYQITIRSRTLSTGALK